MLTPIENKRRKSEMVAGTYLATITDIYLHRNAEKAPILIDGHTVIIVQFCNNEKQVHEALYVMDKGVRQKYFMNTLADAGIEIVEGAQVQKNDCLKKQLWISIKEIHYVNDEVVLTDGDGKPLIDYHIFKTGKVREGMKSPQIKGDPAANNGIACDLFVTYKNVSDGFTKEEKVVVAKRIIGETIKLPESKPMVHEIHLGIEGYKRMDEMLTKEVREKLGEGADEMPTF